MAWALAVPIFEAPDEPAHWQYARYLHDTWKLPIYQAGFEEANSPPLYYLAIAPFATASKLPPMVVVNDARGQGMSMAPPRVFASSDRDWDWYRPVLVARLWTVLLSLVTIVVVYRTAAMLLPWSGALATAALAAFLPQFSFRAVTVSNDAAVILFAALLTMSCVQLLTRGFTWRRGLIAAVTLAAAYLSKILAIALAAPLALALLEAPAVSRRTDDGAEATDVRVPMRARVLRLSVLLVSLALVLPWSLRNVMLYGDPTARNAMRTAVSHLITDRSLFSAYFLWDFPLLLFASFIAVFGWANVVLPKWIYLVFVVLCLIAAAGVVRGWFLRAIDGRILRMLVLLDRVRRGRGGVHQLDVHAAAGPLHAAGAAGGRAIRRARLDASARAARLAVARRRSGRAVLVQCLVSRRRDRSGLLAAAVAHDRAGRACDASCRGRRPGVHSESRGGRWLDAALRCIGERPVAPDGRRRRRLQLRHHRGGTRGTRARSDGCARARSCSRRVLRGSISVSEWNLHGARMAHDKSSASLSTAWALARCDHARPHRSVRTGGLPPPENGGTPVAAASAPDRGRIEIGAITLRARPPA